VNPPKPVTVELLLEFPLPPTVTPGAVHPGRIPSVVSFARSFEVEIAGLARSDLLYPSRTVLTIEGLKTWFSSRV